MPSQTCCLSYDCCGCCEIVPWGDVDLHVSGAGRVLLHCDDNYDGDYVDDDIGYDVPDEVGQTSHYDLEKAALA